MLIDRTLTEEINAKLFAERRKIVVVCGARQVGKTTMVKGVLKDVNKKNTLHKR